MRRGCYCAPGVEVSVRVLSSGFLGKILAGEIAAEEDEVLNSCLSVGLR